MRIANKKLFRCSFHEQRHIQIARTIDEMRTFRASCHNSVGFIPTMGALHSGHLSLISKAIESNDSVVVSIFVNPKQFSVGEDFDKYPRQLENDLEILQKKFPSGISCLFYPSESEMYPSKPLCHIEPAEFSNIFEGQRRPDFFRGVATVVGKLFNIVQPTEAYFGQKDISQCILLQRLVKDLNMPVKVNVCRTIREADGLAMSSRNAYLSKDERQSASVLFEALSIGKQKLIELGEKNGIVNSQYISLEIHRRLLQEPMVTNVEYISLADPFNMQEKKEYNHDDGNDGVVLSAAIRIGQTRLIDNVLVGSAEKIITH